MNLIAYNYRRWLLWHLCLHPKSKVVVFTHSYRPASNGTTTRRHLSLLELTIAIPEHSWESFTLKKNMMIMVYWKCLSVKITQVCDTKFFAKNAFFSFADFFNFNIALYYYRFVWFLALETVSDMGLILRPHSTDFSASVRPNIMILEWMQ